MYRRVRNVGVIGALLILAAAALRVQMASGPRAGQQEVNIQEVSFAERGDVQVTVSATGSIRPHQQLPMFFLLPGTVDEVLVAEGESVRTGQTLARLETDDLELAVRETELTLALQQVAFDLLTADPRDVALDVAEAAVYAANAQLAFAQELPDPRNERIALLQLELARNQLWQIQMQRDQARLLNRFGLDRSGQYRQAETSVNRTEYEVSIAEQQLSQVQNATANPSNVASARAALVNAQSALQRLLDGPTEIDLDIANGQLQMAYLAVELARYQLSQAVLEAPFDGTVVAVNLVPGEAPPLTVPALELIDTAGYYLDVAVDEIDIVQVGFGQLAEIRLDALPDEQLSGTVTRIEDVATNLGGVITYRVRVTLDPSAVPVRVGMSVTVTILVDEVTDVVRVRNRFIRLDRRTQQAFVTVRHTDGVLEEVEVMLGRRNETYSEIVSGLNEGAEIVLVPRSTFDPFGFAP